MISTRIMDTQKSMLSFVNKESMIIALTVFVFISTINFLFAQNNTPINNTAPPANIGSDWLNAIVNETIAIVGSIMALGVSALVQWMRSKGIPVTNEQEAMFRDIVTDRFSKLAKDSWTTMRDHPENFDRYWNELSQGHVPKEFQDELRNQGYDFAMKLKQNREFRDFAKNITESSMQRLLKDLRTDLKNDYQKRMLDVIPKIASTAVDSAFDPKVGDVETWSRTALENLKPLLLSTEAMDNENNLMIIIRAEINKRLQERLRLPVDNNQG
jgi:hypothetical protein